MTSGAGKADGKVIDACHTGAWQNANVPGWKIRLYMEGEYSIHTIQHTVVDQRSGFFSGFFRRLKHQPYCAGKKVPAVLQKPRCTQQHGGMGIVSAGMHNARKL